MSPKSSVPQAARFVSHVLVSDMADPDYGWTVEMQVRAAQYGLAFHEIPVRYRRRIGVSKVSGTFRGVIGAGTKILYIIFREALVGKGKLRLRH